MNKLVLEILRINHQEELHQDYSLSKIFLLKCFTIFFLLVSVYPFKAYSIPPDFHKKIDQKNPTSESENTLTTEERIRKEIEKRLTKEIEERIRKEMEESINEEGLLDELIRNLNTLPTDFYAHLTFYLATILSGGFLFLTPTGQIILMARGGALKELGIFLLSIGALGETTNINHLLTKEQKNNIASIADYFIKYPPLKELFLTLLYSTDENNKYLAQILLQDPTSENLIRELLPAIAIEDNKYSVPTQETIISTLRGFQDIEEDLRREAIENLKYIIDNNTSPSLIELAISVLGKIGEGVEGVAEYLIDIGDDKSNSDELRFIALVELGRNRDYFLTSIEELSKWLEGRENEDRVNIVKQLIIQPKIPDSFIDSVLSITKEELSKHHIIVVKRLVHSEILGLELQLKFSETLLNWDDSVKNKAFLSEVYSSPVEDISSYMKNTLFKERLSKEDDTAYKFLITEISTLKDTHPIEILYSIEKSIIERFETNYPKQLEIALKLENIVDSYKKVLESIQN